MKKSVCVKTVVTLLILLSMFQIMRNMKYVHAQMISMEDCAVNIENQLSDSNQIPDIVSITKKKINVGLNVISKNKITLYWASSESVKEYSIYRKKKEGKYHKLKQLLNVNTKGAEQGICRYTDKKVLKNQNYQYKIVPIYMDNTKGVPTYIDYDCRKIVNVQKQKYSYKEMKSDIIALSKKYSEYCSYKVIGVTEGKRNIYDVIIGNPNAKKSILVVNTLHAREYACSVLAMRNLEYYLEHYNDSLSGIKPCKIFDDVQLHVVTMANPDGVTISQQSHSYWKSNGNGVDLNRNFPYHFKRMGTKGASEYSGKKAGSEKESKAIIKLSKRLKKETTLCAQINYHAMGQIVFGDYDGNNARVKKDTQKMYNIARQCTGYSDAAGYPGTSNGNYREYVMYGLKVPSITIEIGTSTCPVSFREYDTIFKKNKLVILKIANLYKGK